MLKAVCFSFFCLVNVNVEAASVSITIDDFNFSNETGMQADKRVYNWPVYEKEEMDKLNL